MTELPDEQPVQPLVDLTAADAGTLVEMEGHRWLVAPSDELLARLERVFGDRVATLA